MPFDVGDKYSVLFTGLSGFWQRFFKDAKDIEAYYQAAEIYLGQVYLDLLSSILNIGLGDAPIFNREYWKLFTILETEIDYLAGAVVSDDRFIYDMPDTTVSVDFLQNAILAPDIVLERDVDFDVEDNDGLVRFHEDPFNAYTDDAGNLMPTPGIAWRTLRVAVGNLIYDTGLAMYHPAIFKSTTAYSQGLRRGDTLRLLAYRGNLIEEGLTGSIKHFPLSSIFYGANVGLCRVGDVIQVYGHDGGSSHVDDVWKAFYIVKEVDSTLPNQAILEPLAMPSTAFDSTTNLYWMQYHALYFEVTEESPYRDYELDYYEGLRCVGAVDNPIPTDLDGPVVYAVVRDSPNPDVKGVSVNFVGIPLMVPPLPLPFPVIPPAPPAPPFVVGAPGTVTDLGQRHIVPGSAVIRGYRYYSDDGGGAVALVEGEDYSIDYLRGTIYQLRYWRDTSLGVCEYSYQSEVLLSGAGTIEEYTVGNVRQLSFWVPEVLVDNFTLWYNYGVLLNRFDASSEAYKAFLKGIMYLYMTGPILQRIEAALNVSAEYPVVFQDGELLVSYDDGVNGSGVAASINGVTDGVTLPTLEYTFSELDVGGYIIFPNPINDANEGRFRIMSIDTVTNSALLETTYGMVTETPVDWVISHNYTKVVTTDARTYTYPYYVPIRTDVQDSTNWNVLTFEAFEPLTLAFTVTDYLEDPMWWQNKVIPPVLWPDESTSRRRSSTILYEHVIGAEDDPCIGDPGLFIGADDEGNVFTPTDPRTFDVDTIEWQTGNTIRYTLNDNPDLSSLDPTVTPLTLTITSAGNALNDGTFTVTEVGAAGYWIDVTNPARSDAVADEASDSPAVGVLGGATLPVSLHRHNVAFVLFDRYLKMHMYYIEIDAELELDEQFKEDLEELVLVAKPSYTYPAVEPNEQFIDNVGLTDAFTIPEIAFFFGGDYDDGMDSLHLSSNELTIGDTNFPWNIGDFFKYDNQTFAAIVVPNPIPVGTIIPLSGLLPAGCSLLTLNVGATRTADGLEALEGRDYTVNLLAEDPPGVVNPNAWDVEFLTECTSGGLLISMECWYAERLNGPYDTTLGWTPLTIGGTNPWYIRARALDPTSPTFAAEWEALRTEFVDRTLQLTIVDGGGSYTYP